jgi:hypothetical protein
MFSVNYRINSPTIPGPIFFTPAFQLVTTVGAGEDGPPVVVIRKRISAVTSSNAKFAIPVGVDAVPEIIV